MPKRTATIAEETRPLRLKMHALMEEGMTESQAAVEVMPDDGNRSRKVAGWKKRGIFPPTAEELAEHAAAASPDTAEVPQDAVAREAATGAAETPTEVAPTTGLPPRAVPDTAKVRQTDLPAAPPAGYTIDVSGTAQIPLTLTPDEVQVLRALIRERSMQSLESTHRSLILPSNCPDFKSPQKSTSLRLRRDFMDAAEARAAEVWPGQRVTQTQLMNFLLWWFGGLTEEDARKEP